MSFQVTYMYKVMDPPLGSSEKAWYVVLDFLNIVPSFLLQPASEVREDPNACVPVIPIVSFSTTLPFS